MNKLLNQKVGFCFFSIGVISIVVLIDLSNYYLIERSLIYFVVILTTALALYAIIICVPKKKIRISAIVVLIFALSYLGAFSFRNIIGAETHVRGTWDFEDYQVLHISRVYIVGHPMHYYQLRRFSKIPIFAKDVELIKDNDQSRFSCLIYFESVDITFDKCLNKLKNGKIDDTSTISLMNDVDVFTYWNKYYGANIGMIKLLRESDIEKRGDGVFLNGALIGKKVSYVGIESNKPYNLKNFIYDINEAYQKLEIDYIVIDGGGLSDIDKNEIKLLIEELDSTDFERIIEIGFESQILK